MRTLVVNVLYSLGAKVRRLTSKRAGSAWFALLELFVFADYSCC